MVLYLLLILNREVSLFILIVQMRMSDMELKELLRAICFIFGMLYGILGIAFIFVLITYWIISIYGELIGLLVLIFGFVPIFILLIFILITINNLVNRIFKPLHFNVLWKLAKK